MMWRFRVLVTLILLFVLTIFIRTYRLGERLEFLGDQGSTAVILYEAIKAGRIPLVGPEVSIGLRPGPIFYYLIMPLYFLSKFNPYSMVIPMIVLASFTVLLLWYSVSILTNRWVATGISFVYVLSPVVDRQSVSIWNPSSIPFFVALLIFSLIKIYKQKNFRYYILAGFTLGASVQLHYTNAIHIIFVVLLSCIEFIRSIRQKNAQNTLKWQLAGLCSFFFILLPYIYYQWIHEFEDIKNLLLYILFPEDISSSVASTYSHGLWLGIELVRNVIPVRQAIGIILVKILLVIMVFIRGGKWGRVFTLWTLFGIVPIVLYRGALFEHYVYFLNLLPYFMLSIVLYRIIPGNHRHLVLFICIALSIWQRMYWSVSPIQYNNDIVRTESVVKTMVDLAHGRDYSFTLLTSRSFSDYHYRFFMTKQSNKPRFIYDEDYPVLFLICEIGPCPSVDSLLESNIIHVFCYDHHCKPLYPDKRLDGFRVSNSYKVRDTHIYMLTKSLIDSATQ